MFVPLTENIKARESIRAPRCETQREPAAGDGCATEKGELDAALPPVEPVNNMFAINK